jgi:surface antigen/LysM repeat protein
VGINILVLGTVVAAVIAYPRLNRNPTESLSATSNAVSADSVSPANPLDQLASANIALTVARMGGMAETTAVTNQADSQSTELTLSSATSSVVAKPQVVTTSFKSNKDIISHTVVAGETVSVLASKYGVTSDSIRWSNGLTGESLQIGKVLQIPPENVNGIVYTVAPGDTADSLAKKYNADRDKIIAFNFAEVSGLRVGEKIVIPNGVKTVPIVRTASTYSFGWGGGGGVAAYGYNGYDYGYCTWYVANVRKASGNPLPSNLGNASTWGIRAKAYGLPTGTTPRVGAAVVTSTRGAGHVAYVEKLNEDGTFWVSEMNSRGQASMSDPTPRGGWNVRDYKIISNAGYTFIY